jgi:hypothetical protein
MYHVGTTSLVSVGTIQTGKSAIRGAPFALSLPGPSQEEHDIHTSKCGNENRI